MTGYCFFYFKPSAVRKFIPYLLIASPGPHILPHNIVVQATPQPHSQVSSIISSELLSPPIWWFQNKSTWAVVKASELNWASLFSCPRCPQHRVMRNWMFPWPSLVSPWVIEAALPLKVLLVVFFGWHWVREPCYYCLLNQEGATMYRTLMPCQELCRVCASDTHIQLFIKIYCKSPVCQVVCNSRREEVQ